jgi:hypothetical protein
MSCVVLSSASGVNFRSNVEFGLNNSYFLDPDCYPKPWLGLIAICQIQHNAAKARVTLAETRSAVDGGLQ